MIRFISILIFVTTFSFIGIGQVKLNNKLVFTNSDSLKRTVTGLSYVLDSNDLVNEYEVLTNRLIFGEAANNDSLSVMIPIATSISEGEMIWTINNQNTITNLKLSINNGSYYPIISNPSSSTDINCLKANEMELLIFNGSSFQEIFEGYQICPQGFVSVNENYCIQQNENISANYWNAIDNCMNLNAKLCTWSEWYFACQNSGLGLTNITNNWEWTESGNNHATSVLVLGNGTCQTAGESNTQIVTNRPYRCCYRKK